MLRPKTEKVEKIMVKRRIAVATDGWNRLEDSVSKVFGRAKTFTIVDIEDDKITSINVLENPARSYAHGAGPIAIKTLIDGGAEVVIACEIGVGASEILEQHKVIYIQTKPGIPVEEAVKDALRAHKNLYQDS